MKLLRRKFLHLVAGAAALPAIPRIARAQTYPSRPVRLIVGLAAGGSADVTARLIGQWLSDRLGQPFIIENRPGAATNIGTEAVVKAAPDGYTLLLVTSSGAVNATLYDNLNFNLIRDISPVAGIMRESIVMEVHPSFPANTVRDFIAHAKANPNKLSMASPGNGTPAHIAGELFKMSTDVDMLHVPYRGGAPALTALLGGQVHVLFGAAPGSVEHIRTGKLRALAVTTARRLDDLPGVPTMSEFVPGFEASYWVGIGAPKNTSAEIIEKLNKEINAALFDSAMRSRLAGAGGAVLPGSAADFGKLIADETEKWGKVIRMANIKPG